MLICTLKNIVLLPTTTTFTKYLHGKNLSLVTLMCTAQMELWEVHTHTHTHITTTTTTIIQELSSQITGVFSWLS